MKHPDFLIYCIFKYANSKGVQTLLTINVDAAFTMMEPVGILTVLLAKNYSKILEIVNFKYIFCQSFTNHMSEQHNDSGNRRQNGKTRVSLAYICHAACFLLHCSYRLDFNQESHTVNFCKTDLLKEP